MGRGICYLLHHGTARERSVTLPQRYVSPGNVHNATSETDRDLECWPIKRQVDGAATSRTACFSPRESRRTTACSLD